MCQSRHINISSHLIFTKATPGEHPEIRSGKVSSCTRLSQSKVRSRIRILLSLSLNSSQPSGSTHTHSAYSHVSSWPGDQKTKAERVCSSKWDHPAAGVKNHLDSNCVAVTASSITPSAPPLPSSAHKNHRRFPFTFWDREVRFSPNWACFCFSY